MGKPLSWTAEDLAERFGPKHLPKHLPTLSVETDNEVLEFAKQKLHDAGGESGGSNAAINDLMDCCSALIELHRRRIHQGITPSAGFVGTPNGAVLKSPDHVPEATHREHSYVP